MGHAEERGVQSGDFLAFLTAASLAVSAGANVKAVQRMLGHASAAMTLDMHADLFDEDFSSVSDALDREAAARFSAHQWLQVEQPVLA